MKTKAWALTERVPPAESVTIYPSTVVYTEDTQVSFNIDTLYADHDWWASSIRKLRPDESQTAVQLRAIDLAQFILTEFLPQDFGMSSGIIVETSLDMRIVVVKMDIEGAEYSLLPHLLDRGAWVSLSRYCSSNRYNAATDQPGCVTGRIPPISSNSRGIGYIGWRCRSVARSWSVNAVV